MSGPKPMSLSAFAKLWYCEAEFEKERPGPEHWYYVWEPLDIDAPEDARPHCCYTDTVIFYGPDGNKRLGEVRTHDLNSPFPVLLLTADRVWREVLSGRVVYRKGRWHMRWLTATNTRAAKMMNAGFPEYRG